MSSRGHFSQGIMPDHDLLLSIGLGKFPGVYNDNVSTKSIDADNNTEVDLTTSPVTDYIFPSDEGEEMLIVSDNVADTGVVILIQGLDAELKTKNQVASIAGTTPVNIGIWSRINLIRNVGPTEHLGNISVTDITSTNIYCYSTIKEQRSFSAIYSKPNDRTNGILNIQATMIRTSGSNDVDSTVMLYLRQLGGIFTQEVEFGVQRRGNTNPTFTNVSPVFTPGLIDYKFRLLNSATNVNVFLRYAVITEDVNE